jgi:hypothetical protein
MIDDDSPSWAADGGNDYTWTEKAYDLVVAGELAASAREDARTGVLTVVASGPCPRCGDHLDVTAQLSAVADTVTTLEQCLKPVDGEDRGGVVPSRSS